MSRGILIDVARLYNVRRLPADHVISVEDLRRACDMAGIAPQPGDIACIRTGHISHFTVDADRAAFNGLQPGVGIAVAEWLYERQISAVASDNVAVETLNPEMLASDLPLPFHMLALREMGMPLGEMWNFEELAEDCAADGRYSFLLCAPPLAITHAFGSPVNPIALK